MHGAGGTAIKICQGLGRAGQGRAEQSSMVGAQLYNKIIMG